MDNGFKRLVRQEKFYQPFGGSGQCEYLRSLSNLVDRTPQKVLRSTVSVGCTDFPEFKRERVNQDYAAPLGDILKKIARFYFFPNSGERRATVACFPELLARPSFPAACRLRSARVARRGI
jgi:hypothetical protein